MGTTEIHKWKDRGHLARPLMAVVIGLEAVHLLALLILPNPVFISNLIQLLLPLLATAISLHQLYCTTNLLGRRCWTGLTCALAIWSLGQAAFLCLLAFPPRIELTVRPDDALWLLFGVPLILAINTTLIEVDRVAWLDRAQVGLFFAALYLLVFLPSCRLPITQAYLIQNFALLLCCLLRLPTCTLARERRFFVRLAIFFVVYGSMETVGDALYTHGAQIGSLVDLVWTLPVFLLSLLTLRDGLISSESSQEKSSLFNAARSTQGLSVVAMAFLSIALSALLARHKPVLGGALVLLAFIIFSLRTNARERAWHKAHGLLEETVLQDALTGLGNRTLLRNQLTARLADPQQTVALLFADLDRFKSINDTLGHALGDLLLVEIGQRLCASSPPDSVVCRLGGDEFVVLTTARSPADAQRAGERLREALHAPFHLGTNQLCCTASIGVVLAVAGENPDDLLRTADHAMYRAKQLGKDRIQLFDTDLRAQLSSRWQMEAELRATVQAGAIQVSFLPIYSVEKAGICGFEALARWSHPVLGNVPPVEFIALAEESGLILSLGAQILEKACAQMASWNEAWGTSLSVSVNVSPRQFAQGGLINSLLAILERTGLPPSLLRLEITETALLTQENVVKETLEQARAHGIRISLDDFGTGYSSLSFLLSLPVDEVKVDRSFVSNMHRDPDREEVVRTVIRLGHSLGKRVVAEGVETEQDLRGLTEMGCECVQGYLISKPLLADAMEADFASIAARGRTGWSPEKPALSKPSAVQDHGLSLAGAFSSQN